MRRFKLKFIHLSDLHIHNDSNQEICDLFDFINKNYPFHKIIITGDITQIDLPRKQHSGLILALKILNGVEGISTIHFDKSDIVRHRLVREIVDAYDRFNVLHNEDY